MANTTTSIPISLDNIQVVRILVIFRSEHTNLGVTWNKSF